MPPRPPEKAVDFATHFTWPVFGQVTLTLPFGGILPGETLATQTWASRQRTETMQARGCAQRGRGAELTVDTFRGVTFRLKNPAKQQPSKLDTGAEVVMLSWHGNGTVRRSGFTAGASRGSRLLPYAMRDFYKPASIEMGLKGAEGKVRT